MSGASQTGSAGGFVSAPLVVSVTDTNGNPLYDAPVTFAVTSGTGQLQASSTSVASGTLSALADWNGQAQVFFELPAVVSSTSQITATTGTGSTAAQVVFSEYADSGTGAYISPFAPSNVIGSMNADGSQTITWQNNDSGTGQILVYTGTNGGWVVTGTLPAGTTTYTASPSQVGNIEIGNSYGLPSLFDPIPIENYAPIDMSASTTSTNVWVAVDDSNNAAFGFNSAVDVNGDPTQYSTYTWQNGVVTQAQSLSLASSTTFYPIVHFIDAAGSIYGQDLIGDTGFKNHADVSPPEPPFVSSTDPLTGMGFDGVSGAQAYAASCVGLTVTGTYVGEPGGPVSLPDTEIVGGGHTTVFDPNLQAGTSYFTLAVTGGNFRALSDVGTAFGTAFEVEGGPSWPAYWDGSQLDALPTGFTDAAVNDSGCVIGTDASGNGVLWQLTAGGTNPGTSGTTILIQKLVPSAYAGAIGQTWPEYISNRNKNDGTTKIYFTAMYSPGPGQPISSYNNFVLTFSGTASATGSDSFWIAQLPDADSVPTNGVTAYPQNINANGVFYGTGTIRNQAQGTETAQDGMLFVPEDTVQVDAFIPQQWVRDPFGYVYNGNSRKIPLDGSFTSGSTTFTQSGQYKMEQTIEATVYQQADPSGTLEQQSLFNSMGLTKKYTASAVPGGTSNTLNTLSPTATPFVTQTAIALTATATVTHTSSRIVAVELVGQAKDPLANPLAPSVETPNLAPPLFYDITVTIDGTTTPATYTLTGSHKLYPAYEVYINGQLVHDYTPIPGGHTTYSMFGSALSLSDSSITAGTTKPLTGPITSPP